MMVSLRNMFVKLGFLMISNGFKLPNTTLQLIDSFFYYIYIRNRLKQLKIDCIIDVGSNDGSLAKNFRRAGYNGHIICFEPNINEFSRMSDYFKGDTYWKGFNIALGSNNTNTCAN